MDKETERIESEVQAKVDEAAIPFVDAPPPRPVVEEEPADEKPAPKKKATKKSDK